MKFFLNLEKEAMIELEDYFPLKASIENGVEDMAHIGFYYDDTDLLEFTVDRKNGSIRELVLTLCKHYQIFDNMLCHDDLPVISPIMLDKNSKIICDYFLTKVYKNGVCFTVSTEKPINQIKTKNIDFSIDKNGDLVEIKILNMTSQSIDHCINELKFMDN